MFHIVQHENIIRIFCLARKDIKLKTNLCLRFFCCCFSLNLKLSKYTAKLCALGLIQRSLLLHMGPDCPCPEDTAGSTVPVPQGSPHPAQSPGPLVSPWSVSPCPVMPQKDQSPAPHFPALPRPVVKLAMKKLPGFCCHKTEFLPFWPWHPQPAPSYTLYLYSQPCMPDTHHLLIIF